MGFCMMLGEMFYYEKLEQDLVEFVYKEEVLLFNFGYQGIMFIVDFLLMCKDIVVYDKDCYVCIYDGICMYIGKWLFFEYNDIESFEK